MDEVDSYVLKRVASSSAKNNVQARVSLNRIAHITYGGFDSRFLKWRLHLSSSESPEVSTHFERATVRAVKSKRSKLFRHRPWIGRKLLHPSLHFVLRSCQCHVCCTLICAPRYRVPRAFVLDQEVRRPDGSAVGYWHA